MNDLYGPLNEKKKKRKKAGSESSKETSLRDWFGRKGAKGKKKGWVDCNAPDGKGGYKSCGRGSGEKRKKYPACRPTPGACKERGKGKSWGKKAKSKKNEELNMDLEQIIKEELKAVIDEKFTLQEGYISTLFKLIDFAFAPKDEKEARRERNRIMSTWSEEDTEKFDYFEMLSMITWGLWALRRSPNDNGGLMAINNAIKLSKIKKL